MSGTEGTSGGGASRRPARSASARIAAPRSRTGTPRAAVRPTKLWRMVTTSPRPQRYRMQEWGLRNSSTPGRIRPGTGRRPPRRRSRRRRRVPAGPTMRYGRGGATARRRSRRPDGSRPARTGRRVEPRVPAPRQAQPGRAASRRRRTTRTRCRRVARAGRREPVERVRALELHRDACLFGKPPAAMASSLMSTPVTRAPAAARLNESCPVLHSRCSTVRPATGPSSVDSSGNNVRRRRQGMPPARRWLMDGDDGVPGLPRPLERRIAVRHLRHPATPPAAGYRDAAMRVLLVCLGNICRSLVAEAALRRAPGRRRARRRRGRLAGTAVWERRRGTRRPHDRCGPRVRLGAWGAARQVTAEDFAAADLLPCDGSPFGRSSPPRTGRCSSGSRPPVPGRGRGTRPVYRRGNVRRGRRGRDRRRRQARRLTAAMISASPVTAPHAS